MVAGQRNGASIPPCWASLDEAQRSTKGEATPLAHRQQLWLPELGGMNSQGSWWSVSPPVVPDNALTFSEQRYAQQRGVTGQSQVCLILSSFSANPERTSQLIPI